MEEHKILMDIITWILGVLGGTIVFVVFPIVAFIVGGMRNEIFRLRGVRHNDRDMISAIDGRVNVLEEKWKLTIEKVEMELKLLNTMLREHLNIDEEEMRKKVVEARIFGIDGDKN